MIFLSVLFATFLNFGTSNITLAEKDQIGFEVGKTWGQNQIELEKSYKKAESTKKKSVSKGGVELKIKQFPMSHYEAVANTGSIAPYNGSLLAGANGIFALNKFIVNGFDTGIEILQGTDFLSSQINTVGRYTKQIWKALVDNLLSTVFAIFVIFFITTIFFKLDVIGGIKALASFVAVFVLGSLFLNFGTPIFSMVNQTSVAFEQTILAAGTSLVGQVELGKGESTKDTTASIMRNTIFDVGVYRPYLLMNYGTTNINEIEDGEKKVDELLSYNQTAKGIGKKKKAVIEEAKENAFMDKEGIGIYPKIGYAIFALVCTIGVGIPLLAISSISLLSQLMVVILFFILVVSFFVSLIPKFQDSWFKPLTGLIGAIFAKGLAAFFIMLVYVVITTINNAIPPTSVGKYASNVVLQILVLNWLMKNRGMVISMLVNRQPMGMANVITGQNVQQKAQRAGRGIVRDTLMMKRLLGGNKNPYPVGVPDGKKKPNGTNEKIPTNKKPSGNRNPSEVVVPTNKQAPNNQQRPPLETSYETPKQLETTKKTPNQTPYPQTLVMPSNARGGGENQSPQANNANPPRVVYVPPSPARGGIDSGESQEEQQNHPVTKNRPASNRVTSSARK
ncbi:CD3337/EF1877 family mobilome membrane protein [Enterococcus sp. AZ103]|uniref:CD3337/EF1877 family mobilome membrane protein n=1 Tax=Enterococcus sp. AZ103 TaxID=2774628 RepID=UPI003F27D1DA